MRKRLEQLKSQLSEVEMCGSVQVDETTIAPGEQYDRNLQHYVGAIDMGGIVPEPKDSKPANKIILFLFTGLSTHFKIPVAFYLVRDLTAEEQKALLEEVIKQLEQLGFKVIRVVVDNLSTNRKMFTLMSTDGTLWHVVPHPVQ